MARVDLGRKNGRPRTRRLIRRKAVAQGALLLFVLVGRSEAAATAESAAPKTALTDAPSLITFNPAFLRGTAGTNPDLSVFEGETNLPPGQYDVDVYVNGVFVRSASLQFQRAGNGVTACLSRQLVVDAGVLESAIVTPWPDAECKPIAAAVKGAAEYFDSSRMRVDLTVPQASLQHVPRGFVPQSAWDSGETTGFVNYSGSYYSNSYRRGAAYSLDSTYFNLQSGINAGMWQWRNSSSVRHTGRGGTEFSYGNTFARRALPGWRSEFTVGETSTSGTLFDAVGFRGMRLTSDERMLSPNRQGYAPVVRGIAYSNARVVIRQGASVVYETSVPPGEFVLDDLYPTLNSGDLTVQVTEADGSVRSFVVPFSAVAGSLRPGLSRYAVTVGRTHTGFTGADNVWFGEATYERGISNAVTVNAGAQFASNNYLSTALGGVLATPFGAFGTGANFSHVRLAGTPSTGWQMKLTYNTAFASTGTSVTLAGYRYSTQGYRSLADTLTQGAVPFMLDDMGTRIRSSTFRQRNRFELMLSQQLGRYGSINASGVRQDYYDEYHPGTQFQIGYQNSIGRIGYNLSVSRQSYASVNAADRTQTVVMLSVSVPLELGRRGATLTSSVSRYSDQGSVLQSTLIGTAGARNEYSYSVNVARDTGNHVSRGGVTAGRSTSFGAFGLGYSYGSDASVFSAYARGSLVAHRAGVLFGPYVADTFGIVEAEDAAGARLTNADGIVLNRAGYGIVPSLAPYRYNTVTLDPAGMPGNVELEETQKRVAPYAGAIPKIRFRTRTGYAVLIDVSLEGGGRLPIGARVVDAQGRDVGVVGQGSRLYARVKQPAGVLSVSLGSGTDKCMVAYDVSKQDRTQALMHTESVCRVSRTGTDALAHDATPPADRYRADRADAVRIR